MTPVRLAAVFAAFVVLAMPVATAGDASGKLEASSITLLGTSALETQSLAFVLDGGDLPALEIRAERVTLHRVGMQRTQVSSPLPALNGDATGSDIDEPVETQNAVIRLLPGGDEPFFAFQAGPATGSLDGAEAIPVAAVEYGRAVIQGQGMGGTCEFRSEDATGCLHAAGVHELVSSRGGMSFTGTVYALLYGPTVELRDASGTTNYASGLTTAQQTGPVEQREDAWILLRLEGAEGSVDGSGLRWFAATPTLIGQSATFESAVGALRVGARDYRAHGEDVQTVGALRVVLDAAESGVLDPSLASGRTTTTYGGTMFAQVSGDVQTINLQAAPVFTDSPAAATGILAALAAGAGAAAYYWPRLAFAAASLYTRLKQPDILGNDVRNRIYDIIRANPGISAREVHRRSEQSWGTVVYHLRQLERHNLVVSRALGRTRNYYENHGKYRGMEAQLACLQSDRALVLARAIVTQPGVTQELLAQQTGFPQPTTSYYVRKLKQAGLVDELREGRYTRYFPHAELPRYIAISDAPQVGQAAPSGVQA